MSDKLYTGRKGLFDPKHARKGLVNGPLMHFANLSTGYEVEA